MRCIIAPLEASFGIGYADFLIIRELRIGMWQRMVTEPLLFLLYSNISCESVHDQSSLGILYRLEVNTLFGVVSTTLQLESYQLTSFLKTVICATIFLSAVESF